MTQEERIPLAEEVLTVAKREVTTGRVRVRTETELTEEKVGLDLEHDDFEIERVSIGREVDSVPEVRTEDGVTIIPVLEEILVIEKRLVLKEEIRVKPRVTTERVDVPVTLRKQHAVVERLAVPSNAATKDEAQMAKYDTNANINGNTISAFFDKREDAERAIKDLKSFGIDAKNIRLLGERFGAEKRGFFEVLGDIFLPADERFAYAEGLERGGFLVTVSDVPASAYDRAIEFLDIEGAVNLDERMAIWRSEGWKGYVDDGTAKAKAAKLFATAAETAKTAKMTDAPKMEARLYKDDEVIPVMKESLRVGKRDVSHGRVRVRSYVVEEPVSEEVSLHSEHVILERHPVDRAIDDADAIFRDRTIEAEERAEEAVIKKQARVVEEVSLRKEAEDKAKTIKDTVRHTEVEVEDERMIKEAKDRLHKGK